MLARTNVLCLDKTGTLTNGTMSVKDVVLLGKKNEKDCITPANNFYI